MPLAQNIQKYYVSKNIMDIFKIFFWDLFNIRSFYFIQILYYDFIKIYHFR